MVHDFLLTCSRDFLPLFLPLPPLRILGFNGHGFLAAARIGGDRGGEIGLGGEEGGVGAAADRKGPGSNQEQLLYCSQQCLVRMQQPLQLLKKTENIHCSFLVYEWDWDRHGLSFYASFDQECLVAALNILGDVCHGTFLLLCILYKFSS